MCTIYHCSLRSRATFPGIEDGFVYLTYGGQLVCLVAGERGITTYDTVAGLFDTELRPDTIVINGKMCRCFVCLSTSVRDISTTAAPCALHVSPSHPFGHRLLTLRSRRSAAANGTPAEFQHMHDAGLNRRPAAAIQTPL